MGKVISVANQKGGAGKTIFTALIANSLAVDFNKRVLVFDVDQQQTLFDIRQEDLLMRKDFPYPIQALNIRKLPARIVELVEDYDVLLIDQPGRADDESVVEVLMICDCVLIPAVSDKNDRYGTLGFVHLLGDIQKLLQKEGHLLNILAFVNEAEGRVEEKIMEDFCREIGIKVMDTRISRRAVYARYNTFKSYISGNGYELNPVRKEFESFMKELIQKFNL